MAKEESILLTGVVQEALKNARFKITLENGHQIQAIISGKMRKNNIRILAGDSVDVEMSAYDMSIGRITYRHK